MSEFLLPEKRLFIDFADGPYAGAEIECNAAIPVAVVREYDVLVADDKITVGPFLRRMGDLFFEWGRPTWNLANQNGPLPATREGFDLIDWEGQRLIVNAWIRGMAKPALPLPRPPSDGGTPPARSTSQRKSRGRKSSTSSSAPTPATP